MLYFSWRNGMCKLIGVTVSMSQGEDLMEVRWTCHARLARL